MSSVLAARVDDPSLVPAALAGPTGAKLQPALPGVLVLTVSMIAMRAGLTLNSGVEKAALGATGFRSEEGGRGIGDRIPRGGPDVRLR